MINTKPLIIVIVTIFLFGCGAKAGQGQPEKANIDLSPCPTMEVDKLADAIFWAEGGYNTRHAYGILPKYKTTTPRQACINTINSALRRFNLQSKETDFVLFLSKTYCPIGCDTDNGTNKFWVKNVRYFLANPKAKK